MWGGDCMAALPAYRAVITGIGCTSPFGVGGYALVADILRANATAIRPITSFPTDGLSSCLGAEVPAACLPLTEEGRRWSRLSQMTVLACRTAVEEDGVYDVVTLSYDGHVVGRVVGDV